MSGLFGCAAAGALSWALVRLLSLPRPLQVTLACLAGLAVLSASWTLAVFLRLDPAVLDGALFAAALVVFAAGRGRARPARGFFSGPAQIAFVAVCAVAAAALVEHFVRNPDGGADAFIIWNLRARWLFRGREHFESAFSPQILFWAHQDYPLLLPALVARGFCTAGFESAAIPAGIAAAFALCAVAVVVQSVPAPRRFWAGLLMVSTPALILLAATEQADVPLSAFLGASVAVLAVRKPGDDRALAAAGVFASLAAWTKNEGLVHLLLVSAAVALQEKRLRALLAFAAGASPFLALLAAFKLAYAPANDLTFMDAAGVLQRAASLDRWWTLARLSLRRVFLLQVWGVHLVALAGFLAVGRRFTSAPAHLRWLSWLPATSVAAWWGILLAQPHDLTFMFKVTVDRALIEIWPAIAIMLFARVAPRRVPL